jgi:hypothetical protein
MPYYRDADLEQIRETVSEEVRAGVNMLTASYLVRRHRLPPNKVQTVLADLVSVGDLEVRYQLLCSGEHQNFDLDREFRNEHDIPAGTITCSKCGDLYKPNRENILISFEPTSSFKNDLQKAS